MPDGIHFVTLPAAEAQLISTADVTRCEGIVKEK
jgi:hypothetical protein